MKNKIFIVIILTLLLVPFIGMTVSGGNFKTDNSELAEAPEITDEEGKVNLYYLSEAGEYFEDHFAFRQYFVNTDALLLGRILKTSSSDSIIVGKDGWLYYRGTLDDYQNIGSLTERELYGIAHNLKIMQDYLELLGCEMYLAVAPNKSSIYPEYMPYYMIKGEEESNYEMLLPYLDEVGVSYIDIREPLLSGKEISGEPLYYKIDTHWNLNGADLAANTILNALGKLTNTASSDETSIHYGDLAEMLYPESSMSEEERWYEYPGVISLQSKPSDGKYSDLVYSFSEGAAVTNSDTYMDEWIEGTGSGEGTLFVFRDSFGSALLRPLTAAYQKTIFSRYEPYSLVQPYLNGADEVLIVKAERNLDELLSKPGIMQGPTILIESYSYVESDTTCSVGTDGGYYVIEGDIDEKYLDKETDIYVRVYNKDGSYATYIPFYTSFTGYKLYIIMTEEQDKVEILIDVGDAVVAVTDVVCVSQL